MNADGSEIVAVSALASSGPTPGNIHQPAAKIGCACTCADPPVILKDLLLHHDELSGQHLQTKACISRNARIAFIRDDSES